MLHCLFIVAGAELPSRRETSVLADSADSESANSDTPSQSQPDADMEDTGQEEERMLTDVPSLAGKYGRTNWS